MILPKALIDDTKGSTNFVFALIKLNKFRVGNCSLTEESLTTKVCLFITMKKKPTNPHRKQPKANPVTVGKIFATLLLPRF